MSLFGALFTGVSALTAQSQSIAMISNNIANVNTTGYKRSDAAFSSLVTAETRTARYTPGSVVANREQRITQQGAIQQTNSSTDVSLSGNGFFVVQQAPTGLQETYYTRAGSFSENSQGFLVNTAGYYLMGWPLDVDGNLPAGQAQLSSLQPVDVAFLGGLTRATTEGELALNLDSEQEPVAYPVGVAEASQFTRGLRVYDTLGSAQDIEFQFIKSTTPTETATSTILGGGLEGDDVIVGTVAGVNAGDSFDINISGQTDSFTISATDTVQDVLNRINSSLAIGPFVLSEIDDNGQITIKAKELNEALTITDTVGTPMNGAPGVGFNIATAAAPAINAATDIYPDNGGLGLLNTPNTEGWWNLRIINSSTGNVEGTRYINFNPDGSLNAAPDAEGETKISLTNINWGNGSEFQDIDVQIGAFTQFAGQYNVVFSDQNGAELGLRTGVEIDKDGIVIARFSNGQTSDLYKLPVSTFTAPNALAESSGNVYSETSESGSFNLREAGQGGAGLVQGSTVEASNVDLADEFSKMIITQRAYSAGTKVISTADEMTEELLRLR